MKYFRLFTLLIVSIFLGNCQADQILQDNLDFKRNLWKSHNITDYQYTYGETCTCPAMQDIIVTVSGGEVTSAVFTPSMSEILGSQLDNVRTIDDLFDIIQQAIDDNVFIFNAQYDDEYGFPELIRIDPDGESEEDDQEYRATDFTL